MHPTHCWRCLVRAPREDSFFFRQDHAPGQSNRWPDQAAPPTAPGAEGIRRVDIRRSGQERFETLWFAVFPGRQGFFVSSTEAWSEQAQYQGTWLWPLVCGETFFLAYQNWKPGQPRRRLLPRRGRSRFFPLSQTTAARIWKAAGGGKWLIVVPSSWWEPMHTRHKLWPLARSRAEKPSPPAERWRWSVRLHPLRQRQSHCFSGAKHQRYASSRSQAVHSFGRQSHSRRKRVNRHQQRRWRGQSVCDRVIVVAAFAG